MFAKIKSYLSANWLLTALFLLFTLIAYNREKDNLVAVIWSDVEGYYIYLPAAIEYHDFHHLSTQRSLGGTRNEKGEVTTKYTCGTAICYLPFYLAAHAYSHLTGSGTTGFEAPYSLAVIFAGVFWSFMGLFFLKKLLSKYFSSSLTVWATILTILLGTNLFYYTTREMGMSHVYSFALFAIIVYVADAYLEKPGRRTAIALGLLLGWTFLVRPTNLILLVFLFFYKVVTKDDLRKRVDFLRGQFANILLASVFFIIVQFPQLLYWKEMYGSWIKYSYEGEHFIFWNRPKIPEVLFDTQNGLFLYSPALLFIFWGLVAGFRYAKTNAIAVSITFILCTYAFASWWAWWFGAAFGHRCYVEYYALFAFPLAVSMERLFALKSRLLKLLLVLCLLLFCYYSVAISYVYDHTRFWDGHDWQWNYPLWWSHVKTIF
jgi:hypothetical protein